MTSLLVNKWRKSKECEFTSHVSFPSFQFTFSLMGLNDLGRGAGYAFAAGQHRSVLLCIEAISSEQRNLCVQESSDDSIGLDYTQTCLIRSWGFYWAALGFSHSSLFFLLFLMRLQSLSKIMTSSTLGWLNFFKSQRLYFAIGWPNFVIISELGLTFQMVNSLKLVHPKSNLSCNISQNGVQNPPNFGVQIPCKFGKIRQKASALTRMGPFLFRKNLWCCLEQTCGETFQTRNMQTHKKTFLI